MDDIASDSRGQGKTPRTNAEAALGAVKHRYLGEIETVTVDELGDVAYEQVADLIADCLLLIWVAGEDVDRALTTALNNYSAEID